MQGGLVKKKGPVQLVGVGVAGIVMPIALQHEEEWHHPALGVVNHRSCEHALNSVAILALLFYNGVSLIEGHGGIGVAIMIVAGPWAEIHQEEQHRSRHMKVTPAAKTRRPVLSTGSWVEDVRTPTPVKRPRSTSRTVPLGPWTETTTRATPARMIGASEHSEVGPNKN